jgi:nucleoside-diphosphate-sugar epimerase
MTVLVTGAAGFLGRHVVAKLLASGRNVLAVARAPCECGAEVHALDLRDHEALARLVRERGIREVVHLAAAGVRREASWEELSAVNVGATLALARALEGVSEHRLVVAGTMFECAPQEAPLREDAPLGPTTLYGVSKAAALLALATTRASWTSLRLFHIYGPGEQPPRLFPSLIQKIRQRQTIETTDLEQVRDLVWVEDAAQAFVNALQEPPTRRPVNVASGRGVPLKEVVLALAEKLGGKELVRLGALPRRPGEASRLVGNPSLARTLLGWEARTSWEEGLARWA